MKKLLFALCVLGLSCRPNQVNPPVGPTAETSPASAVTISDEMKAKKADVFARHRRKLASWKTEHSATGISMYHAYHAMLNSLLGNDVPHQKIRQCFTDFYNANMLNPRDSSTELQPWFIANDRGAQYDLSWILTKLGLQSNELVKIPDFPSIIAVGPYKPTGHAAEFILTEELINLYSSDEYVVLNVRLFGQMGTSPIVRDITAAKQTGEEDWLWVGHLPSINQFFLLNGKEKLFTAFNISNAEDVVMRLVEANKTEETMPSRFALKGDISSIELSKVKLSPEMMKLYQAYEADTSKLPGFLSYQLTHSLPNYSTKIDNLIADEFTCK